MFGLRLVATALVVALGVQIVSGDDRGGIPFESRAIAALGLVGILLVIWKARSWTSRWIRITAIAGALLWTVVAVAWVLPVDTSFGSCGSVLFREQPIGDSDGDCDVSVAGLYNRTIPLFLGATVVTSLAGVGVAKETSRRSAGMGSPARSAPPSSLP